MPRPMPEGWVRPAAKQTEREYIGQPIPLQTVLGRVPAKWVEGLRNNEAANDCCREPKNFTYQTLKTDKDMKEPNMAQLVCTVCGAKHLHAAVGGNGNA